MSGCQNPQLALLCVWVVGTVLIVGLATTHHARPDSDSLLAIKYIPYTPEAVTVSLQLEKGTRLSCGQHTPTVGFTLIDIEPHTYTTADVSVFSFLASQGLLHSVQAKAEMRSCSPQLLPSIIARVGIPEIYSPHCARFLQGKCMFWAPELVATHVVPTVSSVCTPVLVENQCTCEASLPSFGAFAVVDCSAAVVYI